MNVQEVTPTTERRGRVAQNISETTSVDERLLVAQAKAGRTSAFGELYERHRQKIYRTSLRILRNQEDAGILPNDRFSVRLRTSADFAKTPLFQHG